MNSEIKEYQINTTKNYYSYFFIVTIISASAIALIQISRPSLFLGISLFLLVESYFFFRKQTVSLTIHEDEISLTYFQFLKSKFIFSDISKVKITKDYKTSNVSGIKRVTLTLIIKGKSFSIDLLDGFDEEDLISFYEFYLNKMGMEANSSSSNS
ncbi:MAG TPA: hypothetical protein VIJ75_02615 [Hanamia sp.]